MVFLNDIVRPSTTILFNPYVGAEGFMLITTVTCVVSVTLSRRQKYLVVLLEVSPH